MDHETTTGSIGKHDWHIGNKSEDGYPVFVDDRQLGFCRTKALAARYAEDVIDRIIVDGDYRLNDKPPGFLPPRFGMLARDSGVNLPLQVLHSGAGFYLGTTEHGVPYSRESREYFESKEAADSALASGEWTQRLNS